MAEQVSENVAHEKNAGRVRRVAHLISLAVLIATMLGAFGASSRVHERATDGLTVEYENPARRENQTLWSVHLKFPVGTEEVAFELASPDLKQADIESVLPEPKDAAVGANRVRYRFQVLPGATEMIVRFRLRLLTVGHTEWEFRREDSRVVIEPFIFP